MLKSDTDSYNYSTIDESVASTESTLRYCLWKKGTQFTYDIPDGLIKGDCVEVKGRLTGKRVVLELSGASTCMETTADISGQQVVEEHRIVPLRLRFNRAGRYKLHSDHLGREADKRGRFRYDFQTDNHFTVQIRIQSLCYDIRINDIELTKLEHGQFHSEIQMLSLDGEAEFSAAEFIDIEDLAEDANTGLLASNMLIGEPMDNSSPASEPELRVSKKLAQPSASKPAAEFDNADDRPKQQRTKRRTEEAEPEKSPDVKVRKTKPSSSSARERDSAVDAVVKAAAAALEATQKSERRQTPRDGEDKSRHERRSRDRKPRLADGSSTDVSMTDDKGPKPSDGEPSKSKRSARQSKETPADVRASDRATSGRDRSRMDETDGTAKAASPKRTKTKTSSRTSSRASNSSNSEAPSSSKLESAQSEQKVRQKHRQLSSSKEQNSERSKTSRTSDSPSSEQRRQPNDFSRIETQPLQTKHSNTKQQQQQQQQQLSESPKTANLKEANTGVLLESQAPKPKPKLQREVLAKNEVNVEIQPTKNSSDRKTVQHPDNQAANAAVDAEEELVRANSVRMTETLPPKRQADGRSSKSDRRDEKEVPLSLRSNAVEEPQVFEQRPSGSQRVEPQSQKSTASSSLKTPRQQRLGSSNPDADPSQDPGPSGSYTVDDVKPHKLKLDSSKALKLTSKTEANQPADSAALTGSYTVKSSSSKVKQQRLNAPSSTSEPQQELDLSGSYGPLQQKPSQLRPPKPRLSASKVDQETIGQLDSIQSGSYGIEPQPFRAQAGGGRSQQLKAGEAPNQLLEAKVSGKRRGSTGDKKTSATTMDGVYRVVPITPVTADQQQQLQQKQQSEKDSQTMSDSLWRTQQLDEDNLISLSIAQIDSSDNLDGSEVPQDNSSGSNSNSNNNIDDSSRKRNISSSSSGLSSVADANKDSATVADFSRQYKYYAAEASPASPKVRSATGSAKGDSPVEVARDASAFLLEPQQQQQQQQQKLPRSALADVQRADSSSSSRSVEQRRKQPAGDSLESINDTADSRDPNDAFRRSGSASENMYGDSKVYDTIMVEPEPQSESLTVQFDQPQTSTPASREGNLGSAKAAAADESILPVQEHKTPLELSRQKSQSADQHLYNQHQHQHMHLFCRWQSYSLERALRKWRGRSAYPEAMSDGIYRPLTTADEWLPSQSPQITPKMTQQSVAMDATIYYQASNEEEHILSDSSKVIDRAASGASAASKNKSKSADLLDGVSDTDSVWLADFSFRNRLAPARSSSSTSQRPPSNAAAERRRQSRRDHTDEDNFILTAQLPMTQRSGSAGEAVAVSDLLETASLASDSRIRDPELNSFRRSVQEDLLARRQPNSEAGAYLKTYRATVESDNHSSFFHVRSTPIGSRDSGNLADVGTDGAEQIEDDDDSSSVSSSESGLSTDSSLATALQEMEAAGANETGDQKSRQLLRQLRRQRKSSLRRRKRLAATAASAQEPEPFVAHLPEPLRSGRRIIVCGLLNGVTGRATISLRNRSTANVSVRGSSNGKPTPKRVSEEEFLVELTHRKEDGSTELVCRQFNGREWTSEQRSITRAFKPSESNNFKVEIHTSSVAFSVRFEDSVCVQPHTIPFSNFTHLVLDGHTDYQNIEFPDELELPYSEEFPQSLDLVGHILVKLQLNANVKQTAKSVAQLPIAFGLDHGAAMLCVLDPAKQSVSIGRTVPETGGFLCDTKVDRVPDLVNLRSIMLRMDTASVLILLDGKPVLSYNLLTQKHYITSFFIDGNFLLKDVSWKEKRAPKWTPIPPSFQVGRGIRVAGLLPNDGRSVCSIALTVDTDLDSSTSSTSPAAGDSTAAFCLRCEPGRQPTVASSASSGSLTMQRPPLASGQRFEAHILCRLTGFEVTLGDCEAGVCQVPHGVEPRLLRSVRLAGGAIFYEVEFNELLGLPYLNRFPVSLKESRFVTVDVANGLHAPRPNTISFALCTGPGDSCLKPLVCEFNMAQGYASVAWADPAGQLRDEDTRKFDPRLAGEVETVALQATDSDYILSVNETALLKYPVRHNLDEIQYVLIDGDICITGVQFEGKAATPSCCIN